MQVSSFSNYVSQCQVYRFHCHVKKIASPLPPNEKVAEIVKRIGIAVIAPFAYLVLGIMAVLGYLIPCRIKKARGLAKIDGIARVNHVIDKNAPKNASKFPHPPAPISNSNDKHKKNIDKDKGKIDKKLKINPINNPQNDQKNEVGNYFVRFIGAQDASLGSIKTAIHRDIDHWEKGYNKGANLYTPNSIQPLATDSQSGIAVGCSFAVLIEPSVELHYWSLRDLCTIPFEACHKEAKNAKKEKYKPTVPYKFPGDWKTVHFTGVNAFIEKVNKVGQAVKQKKDFYLTKNGKQKSINVLKTNHNEGVITYHPEKNVKGFLIKNTPEEIRLAKDFKNTYTDKNGQKVFDNVFLAYQDADGKIVKIDT